MTSRWRSNCSSGTSPRLPRARFSISEGRLEVSLSDIDQEWLERRTPMLEVLVSQVIGDPGGVRLLVVS